MTTALSIRHEVPWIPAVTLDGDLQTLTLQQTFERAHELAEVVAEPLIWAAIMRFLPGVAALITAEDPKVLDGAHITGFPQTAIDRALNKVDDRLWLRHPDTPFMQDALISETGNSNTTEWLLNAAPAANSKAWWGKAGDRVHRDAGVPARLAQGLVTAWFFDVGVSGKALGYYTDDPDTGWRPRGVLGYHNHGLRVFHRGKNLAHTILANTLHQHVIGRRTGAPLWAKPEGASPTDSPLTASTWTGSTYLLEFDEDGNAVGVRTAGRRIPGAPTDPDERKKFISHIEKDIWRADPTIPRAPVMKAGEETGEVRPIRALHPTANSVQWVGEWYAADERRAAARPMEPGLVGAAHSDVFSILLEGERSGPEVAAYGRVRGLSEIASPRAHSRLASVSSLLVLPLRKILVGALIKALGPDVASPLHDKLFASFCLEAEPVLDDIIHADSLTRGQVTDFAAAALRAFERFITPYWTSHTLAGKHSEGVAAAIGYLSDRVAAAVREVKG